MDIQQATVGNVNGVIQLGKKMSMKGKEHLRTIEDYLVDRGWTEHSELGGYWKSQMGVQKYSALGAFYRQLEIDCSEDEGGWQVAGITLERQSYAWIGALS